MTQDLALIGAGAMGGAIGARLLATGARLVVFDPDPEKRAALVALGARAAASAAEAAAAAEAVILSLNLGRASSAPPSLAPAVLPKGQGPAR